MDPAARDHQQRGRHGGRGVPGRGPRLLRGAPLRGGRRTADPGELDGVLQRAGSRRIVVAGGDGSLHAVISALHRRHELNDAVVGLLPMGTGNDFARALGIPLDTEEAARRRSLAGEVRPMDLIVDELGEIVVNNVHVGAGAQASRRGARWKERLGSSASARSTSASSATRSARPCTRPRLHMHVEVDGEVVNDLDQPVLMVSVGNGAHVGGGTELTPEADPEDGKVDVMISHAVGPVAKVGYAVQLRPRRAPRARRRRATCAATRCRSRARSSGAARTARSTARSGSAPGTSSRRRTRWCCRRPGQGGSDRAC